jgi:hypothetical protein
MTKSKKRQHRKKHYRISRRKLIKKGRKRQTGGDVRRFLRNVRLVNMIPQRSIAFVDAHGCILGTVADKIGVPRRFVLPNNVNIITMTALNKNVEDVACKLLSYDSKDKLKSYISNSAMFQHDNMGSKPTDDFKIYCRAHLRTMYPGEPPALYEIENPEGILHVRNHIYPSEINDAFVSNIHTIKDGGISIYSKGVLVTKVASYDTVDGQNLPLDNMPISVLLCYLFGKQEMQEIITLPYLTILLDTCRTYCDKSDVDSVTDDTVYSALADAQAVSHVKLGLTLSPDDEVLITGTSNLDVNTRIGVVKELIANGRYGVSIDGAMASYAMVNLRKIVRMSMAAPPPHEDTVVLYRLNADRNKTSSGKLITRDTPRPGTVLIEDCYSYRYFEIPNDDVYLIF